MQTVAIAPGTVGADYTGLTLAIESWLAAQHARFVLRYISAGGTWKHIAPAEIDTLHAKGIAVVLNSEGSTSDYAGGAARGRLYGANARLKAQQLGYPEGLPLVVSVDTGLTAAQMPLARAFVLAFYAAAAPYASALYGPVNLYHAVRSSTSFYWLPNAASWRLGLTSSDVVHVDQRRQLVPPGVDPNIARAPFRAWLPTPDAPPPIAPATSATGDQMLYAYIDPNGTVWIGNGLARRALESMTQFDQYVFLGTTGGGPKIISANGTEVHAIGDVAKVGAATIDALGRVI